MTNNAKKLINESTIDERLKAITSLVEARLCHKLGGLEEVPEELGYIVDEVSIARFNRIGSEGLSSHSIEGESMSWSDDDFAPYEDDLRDWLNRQEETKRGRVRFI